jgi:uncharacterized repeat protein (TIGR01451 family)
MGSRETSKRRWARRTAAWSSTVAVVTVAFFAFAGAASAATTSDYFTVIDTGGANDVNASQVDLTQMGRDDSDPLYFRLFWSWDATDDWTGSGQTGDACALFDTNGDGNINYAVCGQITNPDADPTVVQQTPSSPFLFQCSDAKNDRCTQPTPLLTTGVQAGTLASGGTDHDGNLITATDPFQNLNPDQNHPNDSTLAVNVPKSLVVGGIGDLVNVCTYPSAGNGGNNNPFDCVANPGGGFVVVRKVVVNDNGGTAASSDWSIHVTSGGTDISGSPQPGSSTGTTYSVVPGTYSASETGGPSGYTGPSFSGDCNSSGSMTVAPSQTKTCTLTNDDTPSTLIVRKVVVNDNGGTKTASDFSFSVNGGAATAFEADGENQLTVGAGTYDVTEPAVAGYTTTYDNCSNVVIANGGTATCTITNNDQAATLIVRKVVVNDNGGTKTASDFSFQVNGGTATAFEADGENQLTVNAGDYDVTEPAVAGYTTTYDNCTDVAVTSGGTATCTITNNDQAGTLIVRKVVVNDDGGTLTASDFSFSVNGGAATAFEADGENQLTVNAGEYDVTEPAVAGYATTYDNCTDVSVANGGTATCTITNNDAAATLIVIKHVINDDGGDADASDFTMTVTGNSPDPASFPGAESPGTAVAIAPGAYSVGESGPAGYDASSSADCSGTISLGQTKTCTITNDDQPATLIVRKVVVNDDGGTKTASDFSFQVNGGTATAFEADGENQLTVNAGDYDVTEPAVAGYTTTYDGCSDITLANGGTATCTITNNDQAATLIVRKVVVNDNGGTKTASDFSFQVNGGATTPFEADGENQLTVNAGTYNVTEPAVAGYATTYSGCSEITLANGGTATCTVTNNDIAAPPPPPPVVVVTRNLTVTKTDDPDPVTVGNNLTYTVTVTNQGPGGATGVTAADQLPATATFVSASSTQGTCSQASGVVTCNLGTLASGASATITIVVRPTATGTILNTVMVVANEAETNNADNTATQPTLVVGVITPPAAPTCASLTVTPRQLTVGKKRTIVARVRLSNGRPFARARVRVVAPGITKAKLTNARGIVRITVRPTRAGIARVNVVNNPRCAVRRVGIIGVFQPPLTG